MNQVKVRYGPSPTGIPHLGNIRTALFNFLFAKSQNGQFLLRIEDTDQARIVQGAVEKIKESLQVLSLQWDAEIIYQSKRLAIYKKRLDILKDKGLAYKDESAWRFKVSQDLKKISWTDTVHGPVEFPTNVVEDFIIVKSDGFPTYHFASVVDDHEMEISHVIRGDEWISSTPKHILLYRAFGWQHPQFVHLPPILGADKRKLSKRYGAKSVMEFLEDGYLPEALANFMVLLGWSPSPSVALSEGGKIEKEIFGLDELIKEFSLDRINKNSPIFNIEKLNWFNGQWIRKIDEEKLVGNSYFKKYKHEEVKEYLPLVKDRMSSLRDFESLTSGFFKEPDPNKSPDLLISIGTVQKITENYEKIPSTNWNASAISSATASIMERDNLNKPEVYRSIGIATLGSVVTPPLMESLEKLGKEKVIQRLKNAAEKKSH